MGKTSFETRTDWKPYENQVFPADNCLCALFRVSKFKAQQLTSFGNLSSDVAYILNGIIM